MRGFPKTEFENRRDRAQGLMAKAGIDALLLTTEPDVRYFTGFLTRFWESPARPWFVIVPATGDPIAVIPSIGAVLMARTWITDIRTWRAPDLTDDGVTLLADTLHEIVGKTGKVGLPSGHESHLRMPLADFHRVKTHCSGIMFGADADIVRKLRLIKSPAEVAKIEKACSIAGRAFDRVPEIAQPGTPFSKVFRHFQMLLLDEGADWVTYLSGASSPGGYDDVISAAKDAPVELGDVLMLDTGAVFDGYFCDYDRNFSIGPPSIETSDAHKTLLEATHAAFGVCRPGATAADMFTGMDKILTGGAGGSDAGRLGHGLGMQLTEWPSFIPTDQTVLEEGMVLTIEPGIEIAPGRTMVHEENIVVTATGARFISPLSGPEIRIIS